MGKQKLEANAQNPLVGTSLNQRTGELAKQIKIKSVGDNVNLDKKATMATATTMDLRPKKENEDWYKQDEKKSGGEVDIDYEMFGYRRAERIKPGHLSLRQFDELLNDYNEQTIKSNNKDSSSSHSSSKSSSDLIKKLAAKYGNGLNETDVYILLQNYKTFQVRKLKSSSSSAAANNSGVDASKQIVGNVFPNLKSLKSSSST